MNDLQRRLDDLEKRARRVKPASPVDVSALAVGLGAALAGGLYKSEYHKRAMSTLREALQVMGVYHERP